MWTYITSVYFMYHRDENDEIEENAFCRFLDCITAFIWAYAITNPGVNSLRTPVYAEMVKIIKGEEVTFSDFKFSEERYRAQITNYVFNNSRAITKSMITWWAFQHDNQDTKKQILAALNVYDVKDVNAEYDKYVKEDDLMQADGSLVKNDAAFQTSYKGEIANGRLHVFVCDVDGQTKYVLPIYGAGLWGPIWGYIALNDDKDTVYGVYFSHQGETPGLGAEITTTKFQDQFLGKHVMENGTVALGVEKHGKVAKPDYQVDGISGGTITSKGVDAMIKDCLSMYNSFLTNK